MPFPYAIIYKLVYYLQIRLLSTTKLLFTNNITKFSRTISFRTLRTAHSPRALWPGSECGVCRSVEQELATTNWYGSDAWFVLSGLQWYGWFSSGKCMPARQWSGRVAGLWYCIEPWTGCGLGAWLIRSDR